MSTEAKKNWYENKNIVIALLVFFFPVGLYGMWKNKEFSDKTKWIVSACFGILIVVGGILQDDFMDGAEAFNNGRYETAIRTLSRVSKENENYTEAQEMIRKAREKVASIAPKERAEKEADERKKQIELAKSKSSLTEEGAYIDARIDDKNKFISAAVAMIKARGYRCDSVSAIRGWFTKPGYTVVCNSSRYEYELEDRGGNWVVSYSD